MRPLAAKRGVEIKLDLPQESLDADFDSAQIQQVLTNLIDNAIQSTHGDGQVTVALSSVAAKSREDAQAIERPCRLVSIRDNGMGISEADREHIFEPFFTTKDVGDGTGLGLSISHGIILEHDGWIEVESEVGRGSCFSVYLPAPIESEHDSHE
jgi:signal transduction histidine kinase